MQALATRPSTSPQTSVHISIGERSAINNRKSPSATLMDMFSVVDNRTGESKFFRFKNESGQLFAPKLPFHLARTHPYFEQNLLAFHAYKELYRPTMEIFDPEQEKLIELDRDDLELQARNKIVALREEAKIDTMIDMLRRLEGHVGDPTIDTVVLRLNRIAKLDPARILGLVEDPDFAIKVLIDKAVFDSKLIRLQEGRFYKFVSDDRLIADGVEQMVLKVKTDGGLRALLENQPIPAQVLSVQTTRPSRSKPDWLSGGTSETSVQSQEDGTTLGSDELAYTDAKLEELIRKGFESGYIEQNEKQEYILPGNTLVKTVSEAMAFYKPNPAQAAQLESGMKAFGV